MQPMASPQENLPDHQHNGFDSTRVNFTDLAQKKLYVQHVIFGTNAATTTNYSTFMIAPVACTLTAFREVHETAGTDGGAVTLTIEKLTGTTAPGAGTAMLASTLSLKATAATVQTGTMSTTPANRTLALGDRVALLRTGTLTSVANVTVQLEFTY